MTLDIEDRLHDYAITLDRAIEDDLDARQLVSSPQRSLRRTSTLIGVAAAAVTVIGLAVVAERRPEEDVLPPASEPLPPAEASPGPGVGRTIAVPRGDDGDPYSPPPWDAIPIAPGTVGWFEAGDNVATVLPDVASADVHRMADEYAARFFRCADWILDGDLPTCTRLTGGNGIEHIDYGDQLGVGVQLGDTDARTQLWAQASGSLWGYDDVTEPPEPIVIPIGDVTGYSYRDGDHAYLAWDHQPGVVVWLHGRGVSDADLAAIATEVRPVELPDRLPVILDLVPGRDAFDRGSGSVVAPVTLRYLDGVPCVGLQVGQWETCFAVDEPALFGDATWGDGSDDRYVGLIPEGVPATMIADVYGLGRQPIPAQPTEFGFSVAVWNAGETDRLLSASLENRDGVVLATGAFNPGRAGRQVLAEGRTTGIAWIVQRQDPASSSDPSTAPTMVEGGSVVYVGASDAGGVPYCLLLSGPGEFSPLCPGPTAPASGLGQRADYHERLDVVEIAADVATVSCDGEPMPIFSDTELEARRFAVIGCDQPSFS